MISGMSAAQFAQQLIGADRAGKDTLYKGKLTNSKTQLDAYTLLENNMKKMATKLSEIGGDATKGKLPPFLAIMRLRPSNLMHLRVIMI